MSIKLQEIEHRYISNGKTVYACEYHIIWCTKYRRPVLSPQMQEYLKTCISDLQSDTDFRLRAIETMPDPIHVLVSIPPQVSVSKVVKRLKGVSSRSLREKFPELTKRLPTMWTRSKFVASTGSVTLDVIKQYVENQKGV